jgi:SAM-dependent methyltransferase
MKRDSAYATLADWFEYLNDDCGYENWSQYLISELNSYFQNTSLPKTGLDIGCGSGRFTRDFQKNGYAATGMDLSFEMLTKARELSDKTGVRCEFLQGDITKFKTPVRYGFVTAINDCVNYVPKQKLLSAFKRVHSALCKDGLFIFDVSSLRKFHEKVANTVSVDDREEVTYLSFNRLDGDTVTMDVTLYVKRLDGTYSRFDERHTQYVYREEEIVFALAESGFELLKVEGHLGERKEESDRICFVAKRK